jgi:thiamine pyrophosphate-dependent acetolactate synthase large subunit-like protein
MDEQRKKNEAAVKAILTSQQFGRVKEIGIQLAGAHAVLDKNVQTQLGLSDDQQSTLEALVKADREAMRAQFDQMRNGGNGDPQQMREAMDKHREAFEAKLKAVLTSDQASHLTAMGGKPFKADEGGQFGGPPPPPPGGGE